MFKKMNPRVLLPVLTGSGNLAGNGATMGAAVGVARRAISLTPGREFLKDSAKRVLAAQELAAPATAPDLPNFVDMRQGEKVSAMQFDIRNSNGSIFIHRRIHKAMPK